MALSLITEVVAYLPGSDLTAAERLVLFAVAERANPDTREAWQSNGGNGKKRWILGEVVGLSATGLRDTLQRLARRELELRVAFGKDKNGRVLYAVYGRQTTFRLPFLPKAPPDGQTSARGDGGPSGRGDAGAPRPDGQTPTPDGRASPFSSASRQQHGRSRQASAEEFVSEATGATAEEADAIVKRIRNERDGIRDMTRFLQHLAKAGDLRRYLTDVRAAAKRAADDADRKIRQSMPMCQHGKAGGDQPHSATGEIRCDACRDIQQFTNPKENRP